MQLTFANFLAPNADAACEYVGQRVAGAVSCTSRYLANPSTEQLLNGQVDIAFLCGLPYVRLKASQGPGIALLAAPVPHDPRAEDRPIYFSDVIVRAGSPARTLADLRGCRFAHTSRESFSGYVATLHHLKTLGESESFFGKVCFTGAHLESLRQLMAGTVDATAIDSQVLAVERRRNPELDSAVRVIASIGPAPIPPVVAVTDRVLRLRDRLRRAFVGLTTTEDRERLARVAIRRFVEVDDRVYDEIRRKSAAIEIAPIGSG